MRSPFLALLLLAAVASGCGPSTPAADRIVLVTIDTVRADRVGAYGDPLAKTPTLDELAEAGVRFEHAFSSAPLTLPSHSSMLTGLDPPRHGARDNSVFFLDAEIETVAERMRDAGYGTAAFVAAFVLDSRYGLDQGFDHYGDEIGDRPASGFGFSFPERPADAVVSDALAWLRDAPDRFFLWVHLYDPHMDHQPPRRWRLAAGGDPYAGEIAFADSEVRRLIGAIRTRWGAPGLVVAVTSDHGDAFGEHGEPTHGLGLYDSTQRVPLILAGHGIPSGVVVSEPVRLVDLAPTLLALARARPLEGIEGRDLLPLARGRSGPTRVAYFETLATRTLMGWSPLLGVRDDRYKYIRAPRPELYDVRADPGELRNIAADEPEVVARLDRIVEERNAGARSLVPDTDLDAEDRARLEALGYLTPGEGILKDPDALAVVGGINPRDRMQEAMLMNRASTLFSDGDPERALELLGAVRSDGPRILRLRANAALAVGEIQLAVDSVERIREQGEAATGDYVTLAMAYIQLDQLDAARGALAEAEALSTGAASGVLFTYGVLADLDGDAEAAMAFYRRADAAASMPGPARVQIIARLLEQGRVEEADALRAGIPAHQLENGALALRLAAAERAAGRPDEARRLLRRAARARPRARPVLTAYATLLQAEGRTEAGLAVWRQIYELDPENPRSWNDLAWGLALAGRDLDRALALATRAAEQLGPEPAVLDTLATVHLARGEPGAALAAADPALEAAEPGLRAHLLYVRAQALADLGRRAEARAALDELRREPVPLEAPWDVRARELEGRLTTQGRLARRQPRV